ncbi:formate nitrite transporter [Micractinium conductrix]|uniref:Formate nitrite transporter n=1 Tax=Micractinium conductrix TaxID=554055 RepID=A0A2P6UZI7_9CHLO|nr:formate nitrite transporter [Micractinium conductrix]|eukprot:PSC67256.1 formate nitrite transporter [Micractinium conductrix]
MAAFLLRPPVLGVCRAADTRARRPSLRRGPLRPAAIAEPAVVTTNGNGAHSEGDDSDSDAYGFDGPSRGAGSLRNPPPAAANGPTVPVNGAPAKGSPSSASVAYSVPESVAVYGTGIGGFVPVQSLFTPPETYLAVAAVGEAKSKLPAWQTVMLAGMAGVYTAMFTSLLLMVGPNCHGMAAQNPGLARYLVGAIGLPFQLMIIKICGAELFTGSTAQMTAALHEGRITMSQMLRQWACSFTGNALGCALGVFLLLNSGVTPSLQTGIASISAAKVAIPLKQIVFRAVLANWFVCLAVWQATAAQSVGGKFISVLGPVSAFIAVGFEHCVANMVIIPLGILTGVPGVTWKGFLLNNLLPVTLGNIFAGSICVATLYSLAFGRLGRRVNEALGIVKKEGAGTG